MFLSFEKNDYTKSFLTRVLNDCFKLIHTYLNEGYNVCEFIAVWKWLCKPIHMLVFSQYFPVNVHYLNDSIYTWNCCNQAQLKEIIIIKCLLIKLLEWNFFKNPNSKDIIATLSIATIEKTELTFFVIAN